MIETTEVALSRPVRLIHPRWPLYIVPRPEGRFLIGATTIESEDAGGVTVRSALELLTAAYAVHPAFGEARIVELGRGCGRPFPDHAPRIRIDGRHIAVNGLYRHGFLLAPALAELTVDYRPRRHPQQRGDAMVVTVNGEQQEIARHDDPWPLLQELDYEGEFLVVAVNHDVVQRRALGRGRDQGGRPHRDRDAAAGRVRERR